MDLSHPLEYPRYDSILQSHAHHNHRRTVQRSTSGADLIATPVRRMKQNATKENEMKTRRRQFQTVNAETLNPDTDTGLHLARLQLLNFTGSQRDVATLAHESGHGCHNMLSYDQGILQFHPPLTLAETASIFGELACHYALCIHFVLSYLCVCLQLSSLVAVNLYRGFIQSVISSIEKTTLLVLQNDQSVHRRWK